MEGSDEAGVMLHLDVALGDCISGIILRYVLRASLDFAPIHARTEECLYKPHILNTTGFTQGGPT